MAVTAALNSIWEVRFNGRMEGQVINNVMHFVCVGASADVNVGLILKIAECFILHLLPVLSSSFTFESITWKQVGPVLGVEQETVPDDAGPGEGSAAALPSYCSAVISKRTLLGGGSHRGRMYIAGIPEDQTTNSAINTGLPLWAGIAAFIACVLAEFKHPDPAGGTDLFDLVVYSRLLGGSSFPYGAAGVTAVDNLVPDQQLGTTRSRKVGRGS